MTFMQHLRGRDYGAQGYTTAIAADSITVVIPSVAGVGFSLSICLLLILFTGGAMAVLVYIIVEPGLITVAMGILLVILFPPLLFWWPQALWDLLGRETVVITPDGINIRRVPFGPRYPYAFIARDMIATIEIPDSETIENLRTHIRSKQDHGVIRLRLDDGSCAYLGTELDRRSGIRITQEIASVIPAYTELLTPQRRPL